MTSKDYIIAWHRPAANQDVIAVAEAFKAFKSIKYVIAEVFSRLLNVYSHVIGNLFIRIDYYAHAANLIDMHFNYRFLV